jgi:elongation factor 1-alpha
MSMPRINLVVVGHKDHGKSTLIGRLLYDSKAVRQQQIDEIRTELTPSGKPFEFAFLLDSLEEERQGGLTIDIMQTPFTSQKYLYTIIDCPGHREFIKKMLTGASQADAAVLVASAKEGIEPQTRQHALLIKTLGIQQLVVAINKMDAVAYRESSYQTIGAELTPLLQGLGYHHVPMIPVSAMNGDNVHAKTEKTTWYTGPTLIDALDETIRPPTPPANKPLRAVVQDTYPYEGTQTIIACKIETGTLQTQTNVVFNPLGQTGRLNQILAYGSDVEHAEPGDPVGLIVDGVDAVERGDVLSYPHNQPNVVTHLVAEVILFSDTPLQEGDEITLRYGTAEKQCRVHKIQSEIDPIRLTISSQNPRLLRGNSVGVIELSPQEPLCLEKYSDVPQLGRFIIEDKKGAVAAGIVLETTP